MKSHNVNLAEYYRILKKIRNNKKQIGHSFKQRIKNNENVFDLNSKFFSANDIKGQKILIIDDVFTSGSTLNECAKILKKYDADFVGTLTVCKTFIK